MTNPMENRKYFGGKTILGNCFSKYKYFSCLIINKRNSGLAPNDYK